VIFLFMQGGPSQMDLFDYKPALEQRHSQPFSLALPKNYEAPGIRGTRFFGPIGKFVRRGQRGMLISEMLPHLGGAVDDICFLHGMHADSEAHAPAIRQLHTGHSVQVRPSMGSWVLYGLGTENRNLPGFITICPALGGDGGTPQLYGSGFLPPSTRARPRPHLPRPKGSRFGYLGDPARTSDDQRRQLDFLAALNRATPSAPG
jgi:hypothetical protein